MRENVYVDHDSLYGEEASDDPGSDGRWIDHQSSMAKQSNVSR
jgi:hypothetical protein